MLKPFNKIWVRYIKLHLALPYQAKLQDQQLGYNISQTLFVGAVYQTRTDINRVEAEYNSLYTKTALYIYL
jgi:hypothetical protein